MMLRSILRLILNTKQFMMLSGDLIRRCMMLTGYGCHEWWREKGEEHTSVAALTKQSNKEEEAKWFEPCIDSKCCDGVMLSSTCRFCVIMNTTRIALPRKARSSAWNAAHETQRKTTQDSIKHTPQQSHYIPFWQVWWRPAASPYIA